MTVARSGDRLTILRRRVAKVPKAPGVYRWLGADGSVLYIGKAKDLRNRMRTYVQSTAKNSAWTEIMVRQITDFDVTVVHSELEAFILESTLIKELRPKYNIMLKDDKGYVYVRISAEAYPRIDVVREIGSDPSTRSSATNSLRAGSAKYFGPFLGARDTHRTLEMLDGIVKYRSCKKSLDALNSGRETDHSTPCLDHQIGKCSGLCIGGLSQEEYCERVDRVVRFFRGNFASIKKQAEHDMRTVAVERKFEKAARLRDALRFIADLEQKQAVFDTSGENVDVFGFALRRDRSHAVLLRQRDGKLIEQVNFPLKGEAETAAEAMAQFLPQYYGETVDIPDIVLLSEEIDEAKLLEEWLTKRKGKIVRIAVPERGKKSKLLEMAQKNAEEKVEQQFAAWEAEQQKAEKALREIAELLGLPKPPRRIEGYDISHQGGVSTVGSMVVFVNGKPKREHYRSFNMRTVREGMVDDYKSLAETLRRRLRYLSNEKERLSQAGIDIGRAKKSDRKGIEAIIASEPRLRSEGIDDAEFLVARRGGEIIGTAALSKYEGGIVELCGVWVHPSARGYHLGQLLAKRLLATLKKGKVYTIIDPVEHLEDYYAELGFRHLHTVPEILLKKEQAFQVTHPKHPMGVVLVYEVFKNKPDASFPEQPDLLLIDGGKGQLGAAVAVLNEASLSYPVAGLAKREEEIFLPGASLPLSVPKDCEARFLLQRVRDESHRFANRKRESRIEQSMFQSKLDEIPGIGPKTRSGLLKRFGSADAVLAAADEDLKKELTESQLSALRGRFPL